MPEPPLPKATWERFLAWLKAADPGSFTFHKGPNGQMTWEKKETGRV